LNVKILAISNAPWDDRNSVGNTQSNWFSDWPDTKISSVYTREAMPDNKCCQSYFQVTIGDIARHFFMRKRIGKIFQPKNILGKFSTSTLESKMVISTKGWKRKVLQFIVEIVYSSKIWFNQKLKNYIKDFQPNIVFCFAIAEPFRYNIVKYVKKHTNAKVVMWVADDVYGQTYGMNTLTRYIYRKRYREMFTMADKVYGVSQMLCEEYMNLYKIQITPLFKGCDMTPCKKKVGNPIQVVYAGNLLYGRDETLATLAAGISEINHGEKKIQLSVYSGTLVSDEMRESLNIEGCSTLYAARPYEEIKKIMSEADIVLHVESFRKEQIKNVRLSFSTKIIDCMQSGSAMMVIGPKGIASVEYPRKIDGVFVVDDLSLIRKTLCEIVKNPHQIDKGANCLSEFAKRYHDLSAVRNKLHLDFQNIIAS